MACHLDSIVYYELHCIVCYELKLSNMRPPTLFFFKIVEANSINGTIGVIKYFRGLQNEIIEI